MEGNLPEGRLYYVDTIAQSAVGDGETGSDPC